MEFLKQGPLFQCAQKCPGCGMYFTDEPTSQCKTWMIHKECEAAVSYDPNELPCTLIPNTPLHPELLRYMEEYQYTLQQVHEFSQQTMCN
jgi:hypothetical protein